jgi:hypothetical protein
MPPAVLPIAPVFMWRESAKETAVKEFFYERSEQHRRTSSRMCEALASSRW